MLVDPYQKSPPGSSRTEPSLTASAISKRARHRASMERTRGARTTDSKESRVFARPGRSPPPLVSLVPFVFGPVTKPIVPCAREREQLTRATASLTVSRVGGAMATKQAKKNKKPSAKKTAAKGPSRAKKKNVKVARTKRPAPKKHKASARPKTGPKKSAGARPKAGAAKKAKAGRAERARPKVAAGPTELDTIKLAYLFRDTTPADIYRALMDSAEHSTFTGDVAEIDARVGGAFHSYSGFIHGTTLELVPDARIVQSWRTKDFPTNNPSSTLELTFTPVPEGTRLEMRHIDVPKDQVEYVVSGWVKHYWDPLAKHLGKRASVRPPPLA